MTPSGFEVFRAGREDCPSDTMLWRLFAGGLPPEKAAPLQAHVDGCALCQQQMARRNAGFDAIPGVDARRLLAATRQRQAERREGPWSQRWIRLFAVWLTPAVMGAATIALFVSHRSEPGATSRAKGGPVLHVFRAAGTAAEQVSSGDTFHAGDRLRFAVDLESAGNVALIGVEPQGRLYRVWPTEDVATPMPAGKAQKVPTAIELDETTGAETLYLVVCPPDEPHPSCTTRGADAAPECQSRCVTTPFVMRKTR